MKALTTGDKAVVISDRPTFKCGRFDTGTTAAKRGDVIVITGTWGDGDLDYKIDGRDEGGIISPQHVMPYRKPRKPVSLPFTIADKYDDDVIVESGPVRGRVYLTVNDGDVDAQASLSPKQAKRVARALLAAAKEAAQ